MNRAAAEALIRRSPMAEHAELLCGLLRPAIHLATTRGAAPARASRIGGVPDLEPGAAWPRHQDRPLAFLAQLRLQDLAGLEHGLPLPDDGLLQWFYDWEEQPWGFDPADRGHWVVRHVPAGAALEPAVPPDEPPFQECAVTATQGWTLPDLPDDDQPLEPDSEATFEAWEHLAVELGGGEPRHRLGGHPSIVQGDMRLECQLASNGIYCGTPEGYADPRVATLQSGAGDWRLLLQLDTDDDGPEWMWGDSGLLYFWMREADCAERAFAHAWCVLQCY